MQRFASDRHHTADREESSLHPGGNMALAFLWRVGRSPAPLAFLSFASARTPHPALEPVAPIEYTLRITPGDTSGFDVTMRIRNANRSLRIAMAAHPEYDDRYWRYIDGPRAESLGRTLAVTREDSSLWQIEPAAGPVRVRYRIRVPKEEGSIRAAWRPFLTATGGLVGGPHSFLYVVGSEDSASRVTLLLPAGWRAATSLESPAPLSFNAPSADLLVDSPILVGRLRHWQFRSGSVPHDIYYWPTQNAAPFDSVTFVNGIKGIVGQTLAIFGPAPYRNYVFLVQDGAYGALEHLNSVTIGAPSRSLAERPADFFNELSHEFFHTWNLMRIRPAGRGRIGYRPAAPVRGLWFSEGLSMLYSDLLPRRARLPVDDSTRIDHLERILTRYVSSPGNTRISPESVSVVSYGAPPDALGDWSASTHLQGEVIGTMLDLTIRDATDGSRSIDDLMRLMDRRFSGRRGFTTSDVAQAVAETCRCEARSFFDRYVRRGNPIDANPYLRAVGLHAVTTMIPAVDDSGRAVPNLRISGWNPENERNPRLLISDPNSSWGRAGLHSGDRLLRVNGTEATSIRDFFRSLRQAHVGDVLELDIEQASGPKHVTLRLAAFDRPIVRIEQLRNATPQQRRLQEQWLRGR
jgi:predicted metalloprotease with PDZ domain